MLKLQKIILIVIGCHLSMIALATEKAAVFAVQKQATYEREGIITPLLKGVELQSGDIITTGADARVVIRFPDASLAKIGAKARVKFDQLAIPAKNEESSWSGLFSVLQGVFRFSSGNSNKPIDVNIKVGNVITAGIRGTDVYTHVQEEKDIVCLIKGKVTIQAGEVVTLLTRPREGFVLPKGQAPLPVSIITEEVFQKWLYNSELQ